MTSGKKSIFFSKEEQNKIYPYMTDVKKSEIYDVLFVQFCCDLRCFLACEGKITNMRHEQKWSCHHLSKDFKDLLDSSIVL